MADIIFNAALVIAFLALLLLLLRLIKGPSIADRAVALDAMTITGISIIVFLSYLFARALYLDIAIIYALVSFLGIVAIARYLEGGL